jgi:hypothetical protein
MAVSIRVGKAGSLDRKVERIGSDGLGIAWRVGTGERLVDLWQKRGVFAQKSLKNGQKGGKKWPFLRAF